MLKIALCDDEQNTLNELALLLVDVFASLGLEYKTDNFLSAVALCQALEGGSRYDLLFLDIGFAEGELNGVDAGHLIRDTYRNYVTSIVYISWVERHAKQLFPTRPLYFIVKPPCRKEVAAAVALYLKFTNGYGRVLEFTYKKGHAAQSVRLNDVVYLESHDHKIMLHFAGGASDTFYGALKDVYEQQLRNADFLFIHASYIVNYDYVTAFNFSALSLTGRLSLPIARNRRDEVCRQYAAIMKRRRLV